MNKYEFYGVFTQTVEPDPDDKSKPGILPGVGAVESIRGAVVVSLPADHVTTPAMREAFSLEAERLEGDAVTDMKIQPGVHVSRKGVCAFLTGTAVKMKSVKP